MARNQIVLAIYEWHPLGVHRKESVSVKQFQAKINSDEYGYYLSVTHNGYQWNSVQLNPDEMEIVISVLQEKIDELRHQSIWSEQND